MGVVRWGESVARVSMTLQSPLQIARMGGGLRVRTTVTEEDRPPVEVAGMRSSEAAWRVHNCNRLRLCLLGTHYSNQFGFDTRRGRRPR